MKFIDYSLPIVLTFIMLATQCHSQNRTDMQALIHRKPVVAGTFYPADSDQLRTALAKHFAKAVARDSTNELLAIVAPHAGYVYSGDVAASAYNQIDTGKSYQTVVIIGSSHRTAFDGASVYNKGNYLTPLGVVDVDINLANKLINESKVFTYNEYADASEHSIEVQLPFLQYMLKKPFKILPIIIGTQSPAICAKLAQALKPLFNDSNLFVISTDFSHYPTYSDANQVDYATLEAIKTRSAEKFLKAKNNTESSNTQNLATAICGWTSMLTLLYLIEDRTDIKVDAIQYKNSGDVAIGDKNRVVGYHAITVNKNKKGDMEKAVFILTETDKKDLLKIARTTMESYIRSGSKPELDTTLYSPNLKKPCGAFVSLHKNKQLRGCIGRFNPDIPLFQVVQELAISSATQDTRFTPVIVKELAGIDIEISVLTPMQKIESIDEIELGKHGIYIKKGYAGGTFLPQVATETGWTKEEFLGHCSRDKAHLTWDGWKNADIYIYEALVFGE